MLRGPVAEPHPHPVLAARVRVGRFEARLHRGVPACHRDADASTRLRLGLLQAREVLQSREKLPGFTLPELRGFRT